MNRTLLALICLLLFLALVPVVSFVSENRPYRTTFDRLNPFIDQGPQAPKYVWDAAIGNAIFVENWCPGYLTNLDQLVQEHGYTSEELETLQDLYVVPYEREIGRSIAMNPRSAGISAGLPCAKSVADYSGSGQIVDGVIFPLISKHPEVDLSQISEAEDECLAEAPTIVALTQITSTETITPLTLLNARRELSICRQYAIVRQAELISSN